MLLALSGSDCSGCLDRSSDSSAGPENTNTTYVNINTGVDSFEYGRSRTLPYKTITYALSQESTKNTVEIANGIYDAGNEENFPIVIPAGKKLVGESIDLSSQSYALISGTGNYDSQFVNGLSQVAVVFDNASEIRDLVITSDNGTALWIENANSSSIVNNISMVNSQVGMTIAGSSSPQVLRSDLHLNQLSGVEVFGSSTPTFLNSSFRNNGVGVFITDSAKPSFGRSTGGGGNSLTGNNLCDLLHSGIESLDVIGARWDQGVFEFSITTNCVNGAEIAVNGAGTINYQYIPPKNNLIFKDTNRIPLDQPLFGEVLNIQNPQFVWSSTSANLAMIAVWDQPPAIGINEIQDTVPIYWFWHSGLGTGGAGFVQHSDGRSPSGGSILSSNPARLFETGRSYYWAVWEWDEEGKEIIASSSLSYFRIQ